MTQSPDSTESVDPLAELDGEDLACLGLRRTSSVEFRLLFRDLEQEYLARLPKPPNPRKPSKPSIRTQAARQAKPPDGLRTPTDAARKLGCSIKTLNGHIESGALRYVNVGHGRKRPRRMFTDADLDAFIANQTRKDVPCPSTKTGTAARRTGISTSRSEVIGFMAARNARRGVKPKK
jgi:hypothetical protein